MIAISIVSILVAITGLVISLPSHAANRRAAREANLRSAWMTFARDSATLDHAYAEGTSGGLPALSQSHSKFGGLVGYPEWCYSGGRLRTLKDGIKEADVVSDEAKRDDWITPELRKSKLLPYPKWNLITNLRVVSGEGPHWSSMVFATHSIDGTYETGFSFKLYEGEFYDFFNTSVGMGVLAAFHHAPGHPVIPALRQLRNRIWETRTTSGTKSVTTQGYFALATLACLTIVVNDEGAHMLIHRRGNEVADNRLMIGPVPSGSHSKFLDTDDPVTFLDTLKREFAEELLGIDETGESPHKRIVDKAVCGLVTHNNTYLLGVGFYPVQGYMSVLTMCVIDERSASVKAWMSDHQVDSTIDAFKSNYEGAMLSVPFERQEIGVLRRIHRRTPCLGEIARIIDEHFDDIEEEVMRKRDL